MGMEWAMRRSGALIALVVLLFAATVAGPTSSVVAATPLDIYPLGDSITWGYTPTTATPGGYRSTLDALLTQAGIDHHLIGTQHDNATPAMTATGQDGHDGHLGYRIEQDDADLDGVAGAPTDAGGHWLTGTDTRAPLDPDVVLVHLGTNDILQAYDPGRAYLDNQPFKFPADREQFVTDLTLRLEALLDSIHELRPDALVIVATIAPITRGTLHDRIPPIYAAHVRELVARLQSEGRAVALADVYDAFVTHGPTASFVTPGLISADGVHPTASGYRAIAQTFADAIQAAPRA
jgi:lysophospholipase L1-like esterase